MWGGHCCLPEWRWTLRDRPSTSYSFSKINRSIPAAMTNLDIPRDYLKSIEIGDADSVLRLFSPDAVVEQPPNRIYPDGLRTGVSAIPAAFEKGRKIFSRQT